MALIKKKVFTVKCTHKRFYFLDLHKETVFKQKTLMLTVSSINILLKKQISYRNYKNYTLKTNFFKIFHSFIEINNADKIYHMS